MQTTAIIHHAGSPVLGPSVFALTPLKGKLQYQYQAFDPMSSNSEQAKFLFPFKVMTKPFQALLIKGAEEGHQFCRTAEMISLKLTDYHHDQLSFQGH